MYLSKLELDTARRSTMRALANPNLFHGAVESAFPGERQRNLWRLDTLAGKRVLLILSEQKPDLTAAAEQFGPAGSDGWETKDYAPLLNRTTTGTVWHFRLTANPTVSAAQPGQPRDLRGQVHAHITAAHQERWLSERAEKHGFSLQPDAFRVVGTEWRTFRKGVERNRVTLLAVTYEGLLEVTDEALFRQSLTTGIGRGKAYGMGLLTVVRPSFACNE